MYFRFYYFTFLFYYKSRLRINSNRSWIWAIFVVSLSVIPFSVLFVYLIRYLIFICSAERLTISHNIALLFILLTNLIFHIRCHKIFGGNDKSENIYKEFCASSINTKINRFVCWAIFLSLFIGFFLLINILKSSVLELK